MNITWYIIGGLVLLALFIGLNIPLTVVKFKCKWCGNVVRVRSKDLDRWINCWGMGCTASYVLRQGHGGGFVVYGTNPIKKAFGEERVLEVELEAQERRKK